MPRFTAARRMGFTLIELLVVIAVIAVLVAILFPIFRMAKETARKTTCANQMKQINRALLLYLDDFNSIFPPCRWGWRIGEIVHDPGCVNYGKGPYIQDCLSNYVKNISVWLCPSFKRTTPIEGYEPFLWKDNRGETTVIGKKSASNYLWNSPRSKKGVWAFTSRTPASAIVRPTKAIMFFELPYSGPHLSPESKGSGTGGANVVFYDGHLTFAVHGYVNWWSLHSDDGWHY